MLPSNVFISTPSVKRENKKLFRPKELNEVVFPEIGMIMDPLFWVKYVLTLEKSGYDLSDQGNLFLWAEKSDSESLEIKMSVLYHSLLWKVFSDEEDGKNIPRGRDKMVKNYMFKRGFYNEISRGLREYCKSPESYNFEDRLVKPVFHAKFKSYFKKRGISLSNIIESEFQKSNIPDIEKFRDRLEKSVETFVKACVCAFRENDSLEVPNVIYSGTFNFTKRVLKSGKVSLKSLCNTNFEFNKEEIETFLESLETSEAGRHLLRSILIVSYFDPRQKKNLHDELKQVGDLYEQNSDFETKAKERFKDFTFSSSNVQDLGEATFFWEINYFLADGETIAREVLVDKSKIYKRNIEKEIISSESYEDFEKFYENLSRKDRWQKHLSELIRKYEGKQGRVVKFLRELLRCVKEDIDTTQMFLELLETRGTLEKKSEISFRALTSSSEDYNDAPFWGVDSLIGWTETILEGFQNG